MIEISVVNSYVLYKKMKLSQISLFKYRSILIEQIVDSLPKKKVSNDYNMKFYSRLKGKHFLQEIEEGKRRDSVVCSNRVKRQRVTSYYECEICKVCLCPTSCFKSFHTLYSFKQS